MSILAYPSADIAIVGGGASSVLLAAQIVRRSKLRITVIERGTQPALGVAYSTQCRGHLLNVRASDMSALADEPDHFVQWLAHDGGGLGRTDFAPRSDYGRYLQDLLTDSLRRSEGRLRIITGNVTALREHAQQVEVQIDGLPVLHAKAAVLATGHRPPSRDSGAYRGNPWREDVLDDLAADATILLIGTSLTMIDLLVSLMERGHSGPIVALSRRGLVPHSHPPAPIPSPDIDTKDFFVGPLSQRTARFRSKVRDGLAWAGLMQVLRPANNELWHGLDLNQRRRFLRHLRPWWDIHRHRVAPQVGQLIADARARGQLSIVAGRIAVDRASEQAVEVTILRRGSPAAERHVFDRVIDCRGPRNEVDESLSLHSQMVKAGLMRRDSLDQGLDVADNDALIGREGTPSRRLFALGPPTRGRYTEIVAIPDIRLQAASMAENLVSLLR